MLAPPSMPLYPYTPSPLMLTPYTPSPLMLASPYTLPLQVPARWRRACPCTHTCTLRQEGGPLHAACPW